MMRADEHETRRMTAAIWLGCGLVAGAIAWLARPDGYRGGPATALTAGLCGGFLGGALVILIAGEDGLRPALSVYGAAVGAIALLDLAERTSGSAGGSPRDTTLAWLWACACRLDPLLLAATVGATIGAATESAPVGALAGLATVLLCYRQPNHGAMVTRGRRRHRG
jgi:uncharacterized membrane protein YeaQ/YmgE (transglycosylase-associated protein family)